MKKRKILSYLNYGIPEAIEGGHDCPVCMQPMRIAWAWCDEHHKPLDSCSSFVCEDCQLHYYGGTGRWLRWQHAIS